MNFIYPGLFSNTVNTSQCIFNNMIKNDRFTDQITLSFLTLGICYPISVPKIGEVLGLFGVKIVHCRETLLSKVPETVVHTMSNKLFKTFRSQILQKIILMFIAY